MKRLIVIALFCASAAVPALADLHGPGWDGGTVSWTRVYYQGRGGEFTLYPYTTDSLLLSNSQYASSTRGQSGGATSFQTFCLESDEYVATPMKIWVSEASVNELNGSANAYGSGSHAWKGGANTNLGDNLDPKTAYLYTLFATGNLPGYAYTGTVGGLTRSQTAGALQRLIWATEGEGGSNFAVPFMDVSLNTAQQNLITQWNAEYANSSWSGIGNVRILQLYQQGPTGAITHSQDQLYLVPVPGAILLGLLGLGAAGMRLRKFA